MFYFRILIPIHSCDKSLSLKFCFIIGYPPVINHDSFLYDVKCFEIESFDGTEQTRYIPVDYPCFEEIQGKVNDIYKQYLGSDDRSRRLNKLGENLAKIKYSERLEKNWFDKEFDDKYPMFFFRCFHPCFQLKFNISS